MMEELLARVLPFWNQLTGVQKDGMIQFTTLKTYKKNEVVYNPVMKNAGLKIVKKGQIRIAMSASAGGELMLYRLGAEEICILSILNMMKQFEWDIHVEAEQESEILTIPESYYLQISEENEYVRNFNHEILVTRMGEVIEVIGNIALASVEQRLAGLLLRYYQKDRLLTVAVTHEMMAKDIGTAREVVTRILKQFQASGYISLGRGRVTLLDLEGLEKI